MQGIDHMGPCTSSAPSNSYLDEPDRQQHSCNARQRSHEPLSLASVPSNSYLDEPGWQQHSCNARQRSPGPLSQAPAPSDSYLDEPDAAQVQAALCGLQLRPEAAQQVVHQQLAVHEEVGHLRVPGPLHHALQLPAQPLASASWGHGKPCLTQFLWYGQDLVCLFKACLLPADAAW